MFKINRKLKELKHKGERISLAVIGCGKMGASLINQLGDIDAIEVSLVVEHTPEKAKNALVDSGISEDKIINTDSYDEAYEALDKGFVVVSSNYRLAYKLLQITAVIDATGNPPFGADESEDWTDPKVWVKARIHL